MSLFKLVTDSFFGTLSDQFKDIITVDGFDELTVVKSGHLKSKNNGRGVNDSASNDVLSNGSVIFVPENSAAVIYSQGYIENIITEPGAYEYQNGEKSIFNGDDILDTIFDQFKDRIRFGGISSQEKKVSFINLREIRGILFGTKGAQIYHDKHYDVDLELMAHGSFSIKITDVAKFIKEYLPANTKNYSFEDINAKAQINNELVNGLIIAINNLSDEYRISELPSKTKVLCDKLKEEKEYVGTWNNRFGFEMVNIAIENIELTDNSRDLINKFNESRMGTKAYDNLSDKSLDTAAKQKIAEGVKGHGPGSAGVMLGMNVAEMFNNASGNNSVEKQVDVVRKLKELLDEGIITKEEFEKKKKEVMGL